MEEETEETVVPEVPEEPAPEEIPVEESVEEAPIEEAPVEEAVAEEIPVEEAVAEEPPVEEIPVEEAPAEEISVEEAPIEETEEVAAEEIPVVETAEEPAEVIAEEPAPAPAEDDAYVPTEEDMAFAASLSDGVRTNDSGKKGFFAPAPTKGTPAKENGKDKKKEEKKPAPKKEEEPSAAIYKKPVAIIMLILSVVAAAFYFLYYNLFTVADPNKTILAMIVTGLPEKLKEVLPTFGGDNFLMYVQIAFLGLIAVVAILGLTGKRGKIGFLFVLLADLVYAAFALLGGRGDAIVEIAALKEILAKYGAYVMYGVYGLILVGAVFFAVALASTKDEMEIPGGGAIAPLVYMAVVVLGYIALALLPKVISFTVSAGLVRYFILGAIGVAILLTLIGVHNKQLSRSANGWLIFAALAVIALMNASEIVLAKIMEAKNTQLEEFYYLIVDSLTPVIAVFGVAGFAASDLRN